ncbi:hypothetical protein [Limnobaculum xujianqingii]|uniref:hypothetical protein n=1 Tax=Limnobaculum xujianqingii TaxID=2738837 RepID=UPI00112B8EC7|nr:hypothetical protein [Limnobaculum xujianqingii]
MTDIKAPFERENRYLVMKRKDIYQHLSAQQRTALDEIGLLIAERRQDYGKQPLDCVVIESDWPEYETVWKMLEARMTGTKKASPPNDSTSTSTGG